MVAERAPGPAWGHSVHSAPVVDSERTIRSASGEDR